MTAIGRGKKFVQRGLLQVTLLRGGGHNGFPKIIRYGSALSCPRKRSVVDCNVSQGTRENEFFLIFFQTVPRSEQQIAIA